MAAQIVGQLRKDAIEGQRLVLDLLRANLPKDFTVYVETPVYLPRKASLTDFIKLVSVG